ncbi:hypothetical protein CEXT_480741 [Caerostris extrusa]|uniref:Uncharacterized protein n=1 Tax=Caerostris extrusa TaxID=172846 RepID=A0AAV4T6W4_CAEEX|nr:hypothetical protein CEXT_480741 [Caerostris extrusa]
MALPETSYTTHTVFYYYLVRIPMGLHFYIDRYWTAILNVSNKDKETLGLLLSCQVYLRGLLVWKREIQIASLAIHFKTGVVFSDDHPSKYCE